MLLLQRRIGESIFIGDDIKVTVLDASPRQVRLGIQAPRDVAVHREEIYQRIQLENAGQAAGNKTDKGHSRNAYAEQQEQDALPEHGEKSAAEYQSQEQVSSAAPKITTRRDALKSRASHPFRRNMQFNRDD